MSIDWSGWTSTLATAFAAVTSAIALRLGRRSNDLSVTANQAAASANQTAEAVARIERERWHVERTPHFDIRLGRPEGNRAPLHIYLSGPDHLGQLDEIKIRIDDDDMQHEARPGDPEVTQADYDNFVWGPYRFPHGADGADIHGKTVAPFQLDVGRGRPLSMERTRPGHWMRGTTQENWEQKYRGHPVRLILTCRRGDEEWVLARPVDQPPRGNSAAVA
jgi:hypothetical protein